QYENQWPPYRSAPVSWVPSPDPRLERDSEAFLLHDDLPTPASPPQACRFHTRCPYVQPTRCRDDVPLLRRFDGDHEVACHWAEQIRSGELKPHEVATLFDPGLPQPVPSPPPL